MKIQILMTMLMLAVAAAHHNSYEDHLLDELTDAYSKKNDHNATNAYGNYIDTLLKKCLEKVRTILQSQEPFPIPDLPHLQISDSNVQINVTLTHLKEYNASYFQVNNLKNSVFKMTEEFDITVPTMSLAGKYNTVGKILNHKVKGNGDFQMWIKNLRTYGKAYAKIDHGSVQLKKLTLDYTIDNITVVANGLKVEGESPEKVTEFLSSALLGYFTDNEQLVCNTISSIVVTEFNSLLKGMTLADLIQWLKHFIQPSFK